MTIKQIGGVFGRNPEFNDVEVTGALDLPDGVVASFGDNKDFQIVHDGSHTILNDVGDGNVYFRTNSQFNITASNGAVGLQFNPGVNVVLRHNNVPVFTTTTNGAAVFGNLTMSTAGGGIDFSATAGTGTSELFDDYEEGTWTPLLSFGNGTTGITYDVQSGNYVKIGNSVIVSCKIDLSSKGTDTGTAVIRGFPYTISSDGATGVIDPTAGFSGLVASGSTFMVVAGATGYIMRQTTSGREVLTDANFLNSAILSFTLCYIAA